MKKYKINRWEGKGIYDKGGYEYEIQEKENIIKNNALSHPDHHELQENGYIGCPVCKEYFGND